MTNGPRGRDGDGRRATPERTAGRPGPVYGPEAALAAAVVRVKGQDGAVAGAGFLVTDDLVLTCAHVVSDALDRPREETVEPGAEVAVDLPLAGDAGGSYDGGGRTAEVRRWIPVAPDRTGDMALLRLRDPIPGARPLPLADPPEGVWHHHARAVGFTDDHPGGIWHSGTFRGPTREGWVQLSRGDGESVYVKRGFSGSPVWNDELGAVVGLMVAAEPGREAQQAFALRTRTLLDALPELVPLVTPPTPFRGLATFQEADADVFFGRDDDIENVLNALRSRWPTVTLCGPSGCGKSSLALAGVVPRMREAGYAVLVVNAGHISSLRHALATTLYELHEAERRKGADGPAPVRSAEHVAALLGEWTFPDVLHRVLGSAGGRVLVVVDQAEALLDRSEAYLAEAAGLLFREGQPEAVRVLLTLRADFVDAALNRPVLGPALRDGFTVALTPMSEDQLAKVIGEPVRRIPAVAYDPGLEELIRKDAGGAPGILPLLGFVLGRLWERQSGGRLRLATYEEIGGVSGALARHAEQAWQECVRPEDEADALRLLTGLVRVLPGSESPLRRVITREEAGETRWRIARALAERRLLVLHGKEGEPQTAELAHEALTSAWPTLAGQVRTDSDLLAARAELRHDLDRWETSGRSPDLLPGPIHLASLTRRLQARETELSSEERTFIGLAARRQRRRRTRLRVAWGAAALVLALIAELGTFLVQQSRVSAEREAEGRSRSLATLSDELAQRDPGGAALVAMAAHDLSPTEEARNALLRRYDHFVQDRWALTPGEARVDQVAASTDGRVVLVTTRLSENSKAGVVLFVRGAGERIVHARLPLAEGAFLPMVSRDGRRIAYLSTKAGGTLFWHNVDRAGKNEAAVLGPEDSVRGTEFGEGAGLGQAGLGQADLSPDAREVVTSANGRVKLQELATGRERKLPGRTPPVDAVWFGPDGNTLVAQQQSGTGQSTVQKPSLVAIDTRTGRSRKLADGVPSSSPRLALSGNGAVLVVCREARPGKGVTYEALRVADGRALTRYQPGEFSNSCNHIAIDETGEHFAVSKLETEWALVGTRPGAKVREIEGPSTQLEDDDLSLVGDPANPVLIIRDETSVIGRPLITNPLGADGPPALLGGTAWGEEGEMLVRMGDQADTLGIVRMDADGSTTVQKTVKRPPREDPSMYVNIAPGIEVNQAATLAADLISWNKVRIWELPSLRTVTDITVHMPPPDGGPDAPKEGVGLYLGPGDELLTVSGSIIEHWNARDGRRLSKPLDVRDLGLTATDPPDFTASFHPEPGHVQLSVHGDRFLRAFSLRTGRENGRLRIELGPEADSAVLDRTGRYATVQTKGSMLELWSVGRTGKPPQRVIGPMGPLNPWEYQQGFRDDSSVHFLANRNSIRFQDAADPKDRGESYVFTEEQKFLAVSRDGRTLLRTVDKNTVGILHLDPALWKKELCDTLGRDLSENERRGLPVWLPDRVCPPGGR
ncbi:serine protease [Streptomyces atratus]|uniref:serine protease n=1 Tax=Streptomyces atratus TaxID=1893 RepID=UPI00225A3377|nr:serine protease [Streptomyces atratus]MCX5346094.1 trypsin-like peptidase domain-containing protein [Streptomyces atratus]